MIRRPPRSTRTDTLFPYTTLFRSNISGRIAQLVEQLTLNQRVLGSSPSASTNLFSHLLDHTQVPIGATGGGFVPFRFAASRAFQLGPVNQQVGIGLHVLHRPVRVAPPHPFRLPPPPLPHPH